MLPERLVRGGCRLGLDQETERPPHLVLLMNYRTTPAQEQYLSALYDTRELHPLASSVSALSPR